MMGVASRMSPHATMLLLLAAFAYNAVQGIPLGHCMNVNGRAGLFNSTLARCKQGQRSPITPGSRVAVVGGGPAGVFMAKLLNDRSVKVVLYESESRLGGKAKTFNVDAQSYDLGACCMGGKFQCVQALLDSVKMDTVSVSLGADLRTPSLATSETASTFSGAPNTTPLAYQWADAALTRYGLSPTSLLARTFHQVARYSAEWRRTMGTGDYMFPLESQVADFEALNQSFLAWLEQRELYILVPFIEWVIAAEGYGSLDWIPAFYGLQFIHPQLLQATAETKVSLIRDGFQTLWERIIKQTTVELRLGSKVTRVTRSSDGVTVTAGGRTDRYDFLVVASPMPHSLRFLDASAEEKALFAAMRYRQYTTEVVDLNGTGSIDSRFGLLTWADRLDSRRTTKAQSDYYVSTLGEDGSLRRTLVDRDNDDGPMLLRHDSNIFGYDSGLVTAFRVNKPATSDAAMTASLKVALADFRATLGPRGVLVRQRWDYFPHYTARQVARERLPWRIWDLQGQRRTWFVGSYTCFETIADVVDYNLQLVNEKLCAF